MPIGGKNYPICLVFVVGRLINFLFFFVKDSAFSQPFALFFGFLLRELGYQLLDFQRLLGQATVINDDKKTHHVVRVVDAEVLHVFAEA